VLRVARPEADRRQENSVAHTGTRLVHLTAGDLPGMQAGTLFRDGQPLISYSRLEERRVRVDFSQQCPFRIGEAPLGSHNLVLPQSAYALGGAWCPMARSGCVGLTQGEDPYAVCVPVAEVLRWCWGSSLRMLQSVLSYQLAELLPGLTLEPDSGREGQLPRVRLTLPEGFVPQDAPTLAWLIHDAQAR